MRINKYLETCGVGSRRFCDTLVAEGRVTVNGRLCKVGQDVSEKDSVSLDGKNSTSFRKSCIL